MSETLEAYCVKCRAKRPMERAEAVWTEVGRPATRGSCPVCGTTLFRMGVTPAHEGLTPPAPQPKAKGEARTRKTSSSNGSSTGAAKRGKTTTAKAKPAARPKREQAAASPATAKTGRSSKTRLVIVESPTKARTIGKFLGRGYTVHASVGHVRDLLKSKLSVDVEHDFEPTYRVPNEKKNVVKELRQAGAQATEIYLATDPDREGEAIAWHLLEAAELPPERTQRVVFHEITRPAIEEAFAHPRAVDMQLVNAQQARRILDRLVGYSISPLLWRKVRSRLSAGRVQSVAQRMIVEREREIEDFRPQEYWTLDTLLAKYSSRQQAKRPQFRAGLWRVAGAEPLLSDEATTMAIVRDLDDARYVVSEIRAQQRRRNPTAPFTTSTLQQEASRRLGFGTRKTMTLAQQLYEGVALGEEDSVGLITYMRTDSVTVSKESQQEARGYIQATYGDGFLPEEPPVYKSRAKNAQEAHEAVRPTSVARTPDAVKPYLERDQFRLYELIWKRFVASQMASALFDVTSVDIIAVGAKQVRSNGVAVDEATLAGLVAGHRYLFRASGSVVRFQGFRVLYEEGTDDGPAEESGALPELMVGEVLDLLDLLPEQHFTQPPPRYTEATLVKALEENGIGRPSTYASIISTIQERGYVVRENKRLMPTELGELVNDLLVTHFPDVVEVGFTAQMEDELDNIAEGEREWVAVISDFYRPFSERLSVASEAMAEISLEDELAGEDCEKCGTPMVIKSGRFGKFVACPNFPNCRNTKPYLEKIGVACPLDGGDVVAKRTKKGRVFYGCSNYPTCEWSSWKRPVPVPCPTCNGMLVEDNRTTLRCLACDSTFPREELLSTALPAEELSVYD